MADDFPARAVATLERATAADTIIVAVLGPNGSLVMHSRSDRPRDLAQIAASLAGEAAERLDMAGDVLDGHAQAGLLIACQDAETTLREARGDD